MTDTYNIKIRLSKQDTVPVTASDQEEAIEKVRAFLKMTDPSFTVKIEGVKKQ